MFKKIFILLFPFLIISTALAHGGTHLGKINFPTSTDNKNAQAYFERGVMWLHSFEYPQARANFQKAQQIDSNFAMAYWGEAMTYNHPLWIEQDRTTALKVLQKFAPTSQERVQKAKTVKEKGFMNAINLLYGEGDKKTRDRAYANTMRKLYQQNPNDDEIASFYALSLLGMTNGERDFQHYMQAAGIVEEIFGRNPNHPGAVHYVIHSYDDPIHAPLGLRAARTYAKTAPDASHALHMPSHIFLALGLWDDVIASNKAAWEAGVKQNPSANPKTYTIDDFHAMHWLNYAYLQKKQYQQAFLLTKQMEKITAASHLPMAKWYYALMRASYITESKNWAVDLQSFAMSEVELSAQISDLYTNILIMLNKGDIENAKNTTEQLAKKIPKQTPKESSQDYFTSFNTGGIKAAEIMLLELRSQIALKEENTKEAINLLKKAAQMEDETSFGYGPPIPVQPAHELLAQALWSTGQYKEAYNEYEIALQRTPNRNHAARGLQLTAQSLSQSGISLPEAPQPYFHKLMKPDFYQ